MPSREELAMGALVAMMSLLLVVLLLIPSGLFVESAETALSRVWSVASPQPSTTTSSTATTSTESTTPTTETTTSTSSTTLPPTTTSTTLPAASTTTTTIWGKRCFSEADCGGVVSELKCKGNTVWNYSTVYTCMERGTPSSYCRGKPRSNPVIHCDIYEKCSLGQCLTEYVNECDYLCDQAGYSVYYCRDNACPPEDVYMSLKEGDCSSLGRVCCCLTETDSE